MVVWSSFQRAGTLCVRNLSKSFQNEALTRNLNTSCVRFSGHAQFEIKPSQWQWNKFKDFVHYYFMVGAIPCLGIIFLTNVFVGPATLSEIPEGYTPQHWEYEKHPITRFIAKYCHPGHQQVYEKKMSKIYEKDEIVKMKRLTRKLDDMMAKNQDYQVYYYKPIYTGNMRRREEEAIEYRDVVFGDSK